MYYSTEVKEAAKRLFLRRHKAKEIQAQLNLPNIRIVYHWIRVGGWEDMLTDEEPLTAVSRRITLLLEKSDSLTKGELDELDRLTTVRERLVKQCVKPVVAPVRDDQDDDGHRRDDQRGKRQERGKRDGKKREKKVKNDVSDARSGLSRQVHQQNVRIPERAVRCKTEPADRQDPEHPQKPPGGPDLLLRRRSLHGRGADWR